MVWSDSSAQLVHFSGALLAHLAEAWFAGGWFLRPRRLGVRPTRRLLPRSWQRGCCELKTKNECIAPTGCCPWGPSRAERYTAFSKGGFASWKAIAACSPSSLPKVCAMLYGSTLVWKPWMPNMPRMRFRECSCFSRRLEKGRLQSFAPWTL